MFGGKILRDIVHRPTGGFPPIYLCDNEDQHEQKREIIKREFSSPSSPAQPPLIMMKDILNKRRQQTTA